ELRADFRHTLGEVFLNASMASAFCLSGKYKKVCVTDPDATMATNARNRHLEPCYKQHTAVDDKMGVTLDVEVTTGEKNEAERIAPRVDGARRPTGVDIKPVTADAGYAMRRSMVPSSVAASMP